jgi:hypothetical protein
MRQSTKKRSRWTDSPTEPSPSTAGDTLPNLANQDLVRINAAADRLNHEALDTLEFQSWEWHPGSLCSDLGSGFLVLRAARCALRSGLSSRGGKRAALALYQGTASAVP